MMHGRIRPDSAPELSGTKFYNAGSSAVGASDVSPQADPMGRSLAPAGGKAAASNGVKTATKSKEKK